MESTEITNRMKLYAAHEKYGDRLLTAHVDENFILIRRGLPAALLAVAEAIGEFDGRS
jgi:hypothetical protein